MNYQHRWMYNFNRGVFAIACIVNPAVHIGLWIDNVHWWSIRIREKPIRGYWIDLKFRLHLSSVKDETQISTKMNFGSNADEIIQCVAEFHVDVQPNLHRVIGTYDINIDTGVATWDPLTHSGLLECSKSKAARNGLTPESGVWSLESGVWPVGGPQLRQVLDVYSLTREEEASFFPWR